MHELRRLLLSASFDGKTDTNKKEVFDLAVTFVDQLLAFLATPDNQSGFPAKVGMAAFADTSFKRRYSREGFDVSGVSLFAPSSFRLQEMFVGETKMSGFREKRSDLPERNWYDLRVSRSEATWVDACFTVPVKVAVEAIPGSIRLGPDGDLLAAGVTEPSRSTHLLKFKLPVATGPFTLTYDLKAFVFAASDPSPVADLRRILTVRRSLEDDPQFLATLDGQGALQGTQLSEAGAAQVFASADVLAAFLTMP
jgi:hypothetical protein